MSKEKNEKKDKWGSIQYEEADDIYSRNQKSSQRHITRSSPHGVSLLVLLQYNQTVTAEKQ